VGAGIGNGGATSFGAFTQQINQWEQLNFTNNFSPVNEFIIYATSSGAEFYVDFASATGVPEPASAGLGLLGLLALTRYRRR
jgi:MYXO-CTERM domain-containing protein